MVQCLRRPIFNSLLTLTSAVSPELPHNHAEDLEIPLWADCRICLVRGKQDHAALLALQPLDRKFVVHHGDYDVADVHDCAFLDDHNVSIEDAGIRELSEPRKFIKVLKPIRVQDGDCFGELTPSSSFHLDVEIEFPTALIGRQRLALELTPSSFRSELSRARTFGFMRDVEKLWKAGLALGASLDNTVALGDDKIINPDGLRHPQEFVRHKMLDAVGDLALAGAPILGAYKSVRGGHRLNAHVLQALFAGGEGQAWRWERAPRVMREAAPVDISAGIMAVNYDADRS